MFCKQVLTGEGFMRNTTLRLNTRTHVYESHQHQTAVTSHHRVITTAVSDALSDRIKPYFL